MLPYSSVTHNGKHSKLTQKITFAGRAHIASHFCDYGH